ncbi:MAG TPA: 3-hydroxyacyl-CoA dehydrogenase family protein [Candidatus Dormibacteraeota bacterium]|nr:3-hydroxyacyl-CoA dehydrogenase family protein [Candidatus Dormibacteraeota bacterium]
MQVKRCGVVGAGVMGGGIAQVLALGGCEVVLYDIDQEACSRALARIEHDRYGLKRAVEIGKVSSSDAEGALARLSTTTDRAVVCDDADLIIEAVPENFATKIETFKWIDKLAPIRAILATNSSGFPVAPIAAATERPDRVIVWHWASPAPVMPLAEIVVHPLASPTTIDTIVALARKCGKNPEVIRDQPLAWGYVSSRVFFAMVREAHRVVSESIASREQVDAIMRDCFRWPSGPFEMMTRTSTGWGGAPQRGEAAKLMANMGMPLDSPSPPS